MKVSKKTIIISMDFKRNETKRNEMKRLKIIYIRDQNKEE